MRVIKIALVSIVVLIGGGFAWYKLAYPTYTYRYRLTVAIEIDGKVHTGSSVIEVIWGSGPQIGDVGRFQPSIRGQAPLVDLGPHGVVIATLTNGDYGRAADGTYGAIWIAARAFGNGSTNDELPKLPTLNGRRDLTPDNMPQLVWLSNIFDPRTARKITPGDIPNLFAPNARLTNATVEITSDPIVIDLDKKLPWYKDLAARQKSSGVISRPGEFHLAWPMFIGT